MEKGMVLEEYQVSATHGFLPSEPPLQRLPPYYDVWETICSNICTLRISGALTANVARMPMMNTEHLTGEPQWRRAYVLLGYMAHAYIWGPEDPLEVCHDWKPSTGLTANRYYQLTLLFPCSPLLII